jgi:hypothetical protein
VNIVFLEHVSQYLKCDRVGNNVVNKFNGLNSIIKPFSCDLIDNILLMVKRKLKTMALFAIFLIHIYFTFDSLNSGLS